MATIRELTINELNVIIGSFNHSGTNMSKKPIIYKEPNEALTWLDAALQKERDKYKESPVNHNELMSDYVSAEGWGFVLVGYNLLESTLKFQLRQLNLLQDSLQRTHRLLPLFGTLPSKEQTILTEYYDDFRSRGGGNNPSIPFDSVDAFLGNLDGDRGDGAFDWRYYLIEKARSRQLPTVSIDFVHEITYASNRIVEYLWNGLWDPRNYTYSKRTRKRQQLARARLEICVGQQK